MNKLDNEQEFHEPTHDYHGPSIDDSSLTDLISEFNLEKDFEVKHNISNLEIAEFLRDDLIVARCVGRSEFGPRALGNRSILANPSNIKNVTKINNKIKYRDFWMPFTPSISYKWGDNYIINSKNICIKVTI